METVIKVDGIKKYYYLFSKDYKVIGWLLFGKGKHTVKKALDDISFEVKEGEIVGLVGSNGAGKSTLMSLIAGIIYPTEGTVEVKGKIGSLINLGAGFSPEYTGRENLYYKGTLMGMSTKEIDAIIDDIYEFTELGEYFDLPIKMYSSGMKTRLGFALATFSNPDVLIIDEVFAVGDKKFRKKSAKKVREMMAAGKAIIFSSHSDGQIKEFCTRVIYLKDGKMVFDGGVKKGLQIYNAD